MIVAATRHAPSVRANKEHMALRDALESAATTRPAIVLTAILPSELRGRLRREMAPEAEDPRAGATMAAVLAVSSAGFALRLKDDGDLEARAVLHCETAGACADVKKLILAKRLAWSQEFALRIVGLGPLIDSLEVNVDGAGLTATTRARTEDVVAALDRVARLEKEKKKESKEKRAPDADPKPLPPRPAPDEVLRAKDAAKESPSHGTPGR
jgi:hypothetical protein